MSISGCLSADMRSSLVGLKYLYKSFRDCQYSRLQMFMLDSFYVYIGDILELLCLYWLYSYQYMSLIKAFANFLLICKFFYERAFNVQMLNLASMSPRTFLLCHLLTWVDSLPDYNDALRNISFNIQNFQPSKSGMRYTTLANLFISSCLKLLTFLTLHIISRSLGHFLSLIFLLISLCHIKSCQF